MKKLFLSDVDGTLIENVNPLISKENKDAINQWRNKGNCFGLVTGRNITLCEELLSLNKLEVDCLLACNGAISFWKGNLIKKTCINVDKCRKILNIVLEFAPTIVPFISENGMTYFPISHLSDWESLKTELNYLNTMSEDDLYDLLDTLDEGTCKISIYTRNHENCLKYFEMLKSRLDDVDISVTSPVYIEITEKGSNKQSAVELIFNVSEFNKDNTIYIGDGQNDIPLFDFLNNTYVMSTAPNYVKLHAKREVNSVKDAIEFEEES